MVDVVVASLVSAKFIQVAPGTVSDDAVEMVATPFVPKVGREASWVCFWTESKDRL